MCKYIEIDYLFKLYGNIYVRLIKGLNSIYVVIHLSFGSHFVSFIMISLNSIFRL